MRIGEVYVFDQKNLAGYNNVDIARNGITNIVGKKENLKGKRHFTESNEYFEGDVASKTFTMTLTHQKPVDL